MSDSEKNLKIKLAPSILSADFGCLNEEIKSVEEFVDVIHVDVMDGHFVSNITLGAPVVKFIKSKLPLDVHLMIENPEKFVKDFAEAGAARIVVHSEACGENLRAVLMTIRSLGCECGVSIKPATSVEAVKDVLDLVDEVLVMTVEPGFGGQSFMEDMVPKIRELRDLGYEGDIAVDGGINDKTAPICIDAGANLLISGSYFFKASDKKEAAEKIRGIL
ncbi:ribulose-phosphate 3-epimerase [Candidatus Peregrinibacteria bacterium CG_4_10_14_0_2_um_filter_38_24]|nr:MAG: ribulose-phosphate 3-epimerase [Candidatus Peregrinibacteria bacterium CG_4_10_14_0_2_um_filter_38_24]PJC39321.1 MAG: ribulose-phosphate 3-epimerase [Candidatus Peregrinibacteria bacterium CG_4_9_14_0_2_um_filter_38_9]